MNNSIASKLMQWLIEYAASFEMTTDEESQNMALKLRHTMDVLDNVRLIADAEGLTGRIRTLTEAAALLHDTGRFPQYAQYRTFRDSISVNHGKLGAEVLTELNVLADVAGMDTHDSKCVLDAVKYHNAFQLPDMDADTLILTSMLRDADKLDILHLLKEFYETPKELRSHVVGLDLPDSSGFNKEILKYINKRSVVPLGKVHNLSDFKLMLLSWVYDLNYPATYILLKQRGLAEQIASTLPGNKDIAEAITRMLDYIDQQQ